MSTGHFAKNVRLICCGTSDMKVLTKKPRIKIILTRSFQHCVLVLVVRSLSAFGVIA
ncbi:hypothetical protein FC24_GL002256 [Loigolactobacillus rennini DSM 20253]|uniref:Uncharacterized protein n=1 Tax=Loigolactobacillus rennini DSM 20253 TaxID=1423796 RepID=A0A0R2D4B0_9LACO|nr:hypothetical protein FC24_GL002256 [Loigolactobacillus rennini DSM 20253]